MPKTFSSWTAWPRESMKAIDDTREYWANAAQAPATTDRGIAWQAFSEQLMNAARDQGRPVFLQFSADWCGPCHVYEREHFSQPEVRQLFADSGVLPVRADLTRSSSLVEKWLLALQRATLPTYAVYRADGSTQVLFNPITRDMLVLVLEQARGH